MKKDAVIIFDNKTYLFGTAFGAKITETSGELCFNTATTGYQEILTDPSYAKQIITFSFPHIGNVGCNSDDNETLEKPISSGAIFRELPTNSSNFRAEESLETFMQKRGFLAICNVDTRKIIKDIRNGKISKCIISRDTTNILSLLAKIDSVPSTKGLNLASESSCTKAYKYCNGTHKIAVIDYGTKENILRILKEKGMEVYVFPFNTKFDDISSIKPDGVLLSNGPGDPSATLPYTKNTIVKVLEEKIPLFGICLGHQLLSLTIGCKVEKLEQGHRGTNHPVFNYQTQTVEITTQNHGFACVEYNIPQYIEITHRSLFDGIIEGIKLKSNQQIIVQNISIQTGYAASVQYHPESSGGPHDSLYLFDEFITQVQKP
jgi:carbamoyl-phosphate synthase small subunit